MRLSFGKDLILTACFVLASFYGTVHLYDNRVIDTPSDAEVLAAWDALSRQLPADYLFYDEPEEKPPVPKRKPIFEGYTAAQRASMDELVRKGFEG